MAGHYIKTIADGLATFDGNKNLRSLYEAIAWIGLWKILNHNTSDPNDLIESTAWGTLTPSQQANIKNTIANIKIVKIKTANKQL